MHMFACRFLLCAAAFAAARLCVHADTARLSAEDDTLRVTVIKDPAAKDAVACDGLRTDGVQARLFLQTLMSDLERSGWFKVAAVGATAVAGTVADGGGGVQASVTVSWPGRSFRWTDDGGEARREAHALANEMVRQIKGLRGIAGTRIVMVRRAGPGRADLFMCDADGRNLKQITQDNVACIGPRWTPDGQHIYYTSFISGSPVAYRVAAAGGERQVLSRYLGLNTGAVAAPDGRSAALVLSFTGNPELFQLRLGGGGLSRLTRTRLAAEASPTWSPDGKQIAYVSDANGKPQIYVLDVATLQSRRLTFKGTENVAPDWGPDGRIAYCTRRGGSYQIAVLDPRTGETAGTLTSGADGEDPSWAPDGRHLVCSRREAGGSVVCVLDTLGDPPVRLFSLSGDWVSPDWSER